MGRIRLTDEERKERNKACRARWRAANRAKTIETVRRWETEHKEHFIQYRKEYYRKNKEKLKLKNREYNKAYRERLKSNPEKLKERNEKIRLWREANKEKVNEYRARYCQNKIRKNKPEKQKLSEEELKERQRQRQRARYKANRRQILEKAKEYRATNKEKMKEYQREYKARKRQERALELGIKLAEIKGKAKATVPVQTFEPKRSALPKYKDFIKTENDVRHYEMLKIQCQNLRLTGRL